MMNVLVLVAMIVTAAAFAAGLTMQAGLPLFPVLIGTAALLLAMAASLFRVGRGGGSGGGGRMDEFEQALEVIDADLQRLDKVEDGMSHLSGLQDKVAELGKTLASGAAGGDASTALRDVYARIDAVRAEVMTESHAQREKIASDLRVVEGLISGLAGARAGKGPPDSASAPAAPVAFVEELVEVELTSQPIAPAAFEETPEPILELEPEPELELELEEEMSVAARMAATPTSAEFENAPEPETSLASLFEDNSDRSEALAEDLSPAEDLLLVEELLEEEDPPKDENLTKDDEPLEAEAPASAMGEGSLEETSEEPLSDLIGEETPDSLPLTQDDEREDEEERAIAGAIDTPGQDEAFLAAALSAAQREFQEPGAPEEEAAVEDEAEDDLEAFLSAHDDDDDDDAMLEIIREGIEQGRVDLYLQPTLSLPDRKVRYFEGVTRIRKTSGEIVMPADYMPVAKRLALMPLIDNVLVVRAVQVLRRLGPDAPIKGVFANISMHSLLDLDYYPELIEFMEENSGLSDHLVFQINAAELQGLNESEIGCLDTLGTLGFRFCLDNISDLETSFDGLGARNFRFAKVSVARFLEGPGRDSADLKRRLDGMGIELIIEKLEKENDVAALLDYGIEFVQGTLFAEPQPMNAALSRELSNSTHA